MRNDYCSTSTLLETSAVIYLYFFFLLDQNDSCCTFRYYISVAHPTTNLNAPYISTASIYTHIFQQDQ
jgi:hypothetical protein